MPAMFFRWKSIDLIEITAVRHAWTHETTVLPSASLQILTESQGDSPFFGSVPETKCCETSLDG